MAYQACGACSAPQLPTVIAAGPTTTVSQSYFAPTQPPSMPPPSYSRDLAGLAGYTSPLQLVSTHPPSVRSQTLTSSTPPSITVVPSENRQYELPPANHEFPLSALKTPCTPQVTRVEHPPICYEHVYDLPPCPPEVEYHVRDEIPMEYRLPAPQAFNVCDMCPVVERSVVVHEPLRPVGASLLPTLPRWPRSPLPDRPPTSGITRLEVNFYKRVVHPNGCSEVQRAENPLQVEYYVHDKLPAEYAPCGSDGCPSHCAPDPSAPLPPLELVVAEAFEVPRVPHEVHVELSLRAHRLATAPRPRGDDARIWWNQRFTLGIAPEDELVLCLVTTRQQLVGTAVVPGARLLRHKGRDLLVGLVDGRGQRCGALLVKVSGDGCPTITECPMVDLHRVGTPACPRLTGAMPPAATLPPPAAPSWGLERHPVDRVPRKGQKIVQRPPLGRGVCLRVLELRGCLPDGLHLQIQDALILQQASLADALQAYFMLEMAPGEVVELRLLLGDDVVAEGALPAQALLESAGPFALPLRSLRGQGDCELVLQRQEDGPLGYSFGSREEFFAAPAPMVLQ